MCENQKCEQLFQWKFWCWEIEVCKNSDRINMTIALPSEKFSSLVEARDFIEQNYLNFEHDNSNIWPRGVTS